MKGKVVLISGGASGIGADTARFVVREGGKAVVADRDEAKGRAVAAELGDSGLFVPLDVTQETAWQKAVAETTAKFGGLHGLLNAAGVGVRNDIETCTLAEFRRVNDINGLGTFLGCKHAVPAMKTSGGGSIVNISSVSGLVGQINVHMGYNASKGAVRLATKGAAVQFARDNIRVNSVHPGLMPPMRTSGRTADPAQREKMLRVVPMHRAGRTEEVANASLFLASDEASYITGAELAVDGGWSAM